MALTRGNPIKEGRSESYLGTRNLLVLDDAHNIEEECLNHISVNIAPFTIPHEVYSEVLPELRKVRTEEQLKEPLADVESSLKAASKDSSESAGNSSPTGSKRHYPHPLSPALRFGKHELGNNLCADHQPELEVLAECFRLDSIIVQRLNRYMLPADDQSNTTVGSDRRQQGNRSRQGIPQRFPKLEHNACETDDFHDHPKKCLKSRCA